MTNQSPLIPYVMDIFQKRIGTEHFETHEEMEEFIKSLIVNDSENVFNYCLYAYFLLCTCHTSKSLEWIEHAKLIDKTYSQIYFIEGLIWERYRNFENALCSFKYYTQLNPNDVNGWKFSGIYEFDHGDISKATQFLQQAIKLCPYDEKCWNLLLMALLRQQRFAEAYDVSEEMVYRWREDAWYYNIMGLLEIMRKNFLQADAYIKKARQLKPKNMFFMESQLILYAKWDEFQSTKHYSQFLRVKWDAKKDFKKYLHFTKCYRFFVKFDLGAHMSSPDFAIPWIYIPGEKKSK
jgi:tetratricopeptide (TPR) repeat protein